MPFTLKNMTFDCLAFFGLGNVRDFLWMLWCLTSRLYLKICHHLWNKTSQIQFKDAQWCPDSPVCKTDPSDYHSAVLAPILHRLYMSKSLVIIFQTLNFSMSSWLAIIWTASWQLLPITCLTHSPLTSVLLIEGLFLLESSFTFLCFSLNLLCHSKIHVCNMV